MKTCKTPCKQCPYRKTSLQGYLGDVSHQPEIFLKQLETSTVHPCHITVNWEDENVDTNKAPICVGALQFMNNSFKKSRFGYIVKLQNEVGKNPDVFQFKPEFIKHHSK